MTSKESTVLLKIFKFIKNIPYYLGILSYLLYIGYLGINILMNKGVYLLNIILLAVSVVFLIIYVVMFLAGQSGKKIRSTKRYFKWFKLGMKGISLFIIIYGFITASSSESSMLIPNILIILWLMQILGEIRKYRARKRRERMMAKIKSFAGRFINPKKEESEPAYDMDDMDVEMMLASADDIKLSDDQ